MTAISEKLGVQLLVCGYSSDEDVTTSATQVGFGDRARLGSRGVPFDLALVTSPGTISVTRRENTTDIFTEADAHQGIEVIGSGPLGQRTVT